MPDISSNKKTQIALIVAGIIVIVIILIWYFAGGPPSLAALTEQALHEPDPEKRIEAVSMMSTHYKGESRPHLATVAKETDDKDVKVFAILRMSELLAYEEVDFVLEEFKKLETKPDPELFEATHRALKRLVFGATNKDFEYYEQEHPPEEIRKIHKAFVGAIKEMRMLKKEVMDEETNKMIVVEYAKDQFQENIEARDKKEAR